MSLLTAGGGGALGAQFLYTHHTMALNDSPQKLAAAAILAVLAGCSNVRETAREYGIGVREAPDEFAVIQNRPLEVPSDIVSVADTSLPEPVGEDATLTQSSSAVAEAGRVLLENGAAAETATATETATVTTTTTTTTTAAVPESSSETETAPDNDNLSAIERFVLQGAGVNDNSNSDIRAVLAADRADDSPTLGERILFWQSTGDPLVDPVAEAERLRQFLDRGQSPTGEGVPVLGGEGEPFVF